MAAISGCLYPLNLQSATLTEPYVALSRHTALVIKSSVVDPVASGRKGWEWPWPFAQECDRPFLGSFRLLISSPYPSDQCEIHKNKFSSCVTCSEFRNLRQPAVTDAFASGHPALLHILAWESRLFREMGATSLINIKRLERKNKFSLFAASKATDERL